MIQPVTMEIGNGLLQLVRIHSLTFAYLIHGHSPKNMIQTQITLKNGYHSYILSQQKLFTPGTPSGRNAQKINIRVQSWIMKNRGNWH